MENREPKTIEELKIWYKEHNLPDEEITRFFIGKNFKEPKAFGIYKNDNGDFVVYKNKFDGSRAVRYEGNNEEEAVRELYLKLKEEIANQKTNNKNRSSNDYAIPITDGSSVSYLTVKQTILILIICAILPFVSRLFFSRVNNLRDSFNHFPEEGYYTYDNNDYYYFDNDWYSYDLSNNSWNKVEDRSNLDNEITYETYVNFENNGSNYESNNRSSFKDSDWYSKTTNDDSYWDSGYDTWDSGTTDWGSDW